MKRNPKVFVATIVGGYAVQGADIVVVAIIGKGPGVSPHKTLTPLAALIHIESVIGLRRCAAGPSE